VANPYDQFDTPAASPAPVPANPYDQFDALPALPAGAYQMPAADDVPHLTAQGALADVPTNQDVQALQHDQAAVNYAADQGTPSPFVTASPLVSALRASPSQSFDAQFGQGAAQQYLTADTNAPATDAAPSMFSGDWWKQQLGAMGEQPYGTGAGYLIDNPVTRGLGLAAADTDMGLSYLAGRGAAALGLTGAQRYFGGEVAADKAKAAALTAPKDAGVGSLITQGVSNLGGQLAIGGLTGGAAPEVSAASGLARTGLMDAAKGAVLNPSTRMAATLGVSQAGSEAAQLQAEGKPVSATDLASMAAANTAANLVPLAGRWSLPARVASGALVGEATNEAGNVAAGRPMGTGAVMATGMGAALGVLPGHGASSLADERAALAAQIQFGNRVDFLRDAVARQDFDERMGQAAQQHGGSVPPEVASQLAQTVADAHGTSVEALASAPASPAEAGAAAADQMLAESAQAVAPESVASESATVPTPRGTAEPLAPDLAPRTPELPQVAPDVSRDDLVQQWRQARTDGERADAAARIAAFDQQKQAQPPEPAAVTAEDTSPTTPPDGGVSASGEANPYDQFDDDTLAAQSDDDSPPWWLAAQQEAAQQEASQTAAPSAADDRPLVESMRPEIGWDTMGGRIIREADTGGEKPEVVGRTPWVGKPGPDGEESQFWRNRPAEGGKISEKAAHAALDKYAAGQPLNAKESRFVDYARQSAQDYEAARQRAEAEFQQDQNDMDAAGHVQAHQALADEGVHYNPADHQDALTLSQWVQRAHDAGVPAEKIIDATWGGSSADQARQLANHINEAEAQRGTDTGTASIRRGGDLETDREGQAAAGAEVAEPRPDSTFELVPEGARTEEPRQQVAQQSGLFAEPTADERNRAAIEAKDAERNGLAGGRDDTGDGGLFDGDRPEQTRIPEPPRASRGTAESEAPAFTPEQVRGHARKAWGNRFIAKLERAGVLHFITTDDAIAQGLGSADDLRGVKGLYHDGRAYVLTDQVRDASHVPGIILHEAGLHFGYDNLTTPAERQALRNRVNRALAVGDPDMVRAWRHAEKVGTPARAMHEEAMAYLAENSPSHGIVARLLDAVKRGLNRAGVPMGLLESDSDAIRRTARDMLRRAAKPEKGRSASVDEHGTHDWRASTVGGSPVFSRAYHGTPHRGIEKEGFRLDKIGSGEGNQSYGHGIYFAGNRKVAEHYRTGLSERGFTNAAREAYDQYDSPAEAERALLAIRGLSDSQKDLIRALKKDDWLGFDYPHQAIRAALREPHNFEMSPETQDALRKQGQLYHAEIPDDHELLDWDKSLSEQPEKVRAALASIPGLRQALGRIFVHMPWDEHSGASAYRQISKLTGGDRSASEKLNAAGIPGLRYLDGASRHAGEGTHNYVIWDPSRLNNDVTPYYSRYADNQTASPEFKRWFGDWQAAAMEQRFDSLQPTAIHVPEDWRGLSLINLRERVRSALEELAASGEPLHHPEIGDVEVNRNTGVKKPLSSSRDPTKLYVLGDLRRAFEKSIYASESKPAGNEPNVAAYEKLLAKVDIEGKPLAVVFTVRRMRDGRQFYNAVTLEHEKTPAVSPRDTPANGEHATSANTGVSTFVRRQLERVNQDDVSKVVDDHGRPKVVYHGTGDGFWSFNDARLGESTAHMTAPLGHFFAESKGSAERYAENASRGVPADQRVIDAHLAIRKPFNMTTDDLLRIESPDESRAIKRQLQAQGYDGIHITDAHQWVAFDSRQIKSASANRGTFDASNPDIRYSRDLLGDDDSPAGKVRRDAAIARQSALSQLAAEGYGQGAIGWDGNPNEYKGWRAGVQSATASLADRYDPVKQVQRAIAGGDADAVADDENVYRLENLMHGRVGDRLDMLDRGAVKPLIKSMKQMHVSSALLNDYLLARHAPERNARIASINPAMKDGGSGITTQQARDIMAGRADGVYSGQRITDENRPKLEMLAKRVDRIRDQTLDVLEGSGQVTPGLAAQLRKTYQHYVPLRGKRSDADEVNETRGGFGAGMNIKGSPVRRALGRGKSNVAPPHILGEVIGDAQRAIIQAEKARVGRAVLKLATEHPNPDVWQVEPVDLEWKFSEATGEAYLGTRKPSNDQDVLTVVHKGTPYHVRLVDPRLQQAILNTDPVHAEVLVRWVGKLNRWLSATFTRYNPAFVPVNMVRDTLLGTVGMSVEHGPKQAAEMLAHYPAAMRAVWRDFGHASGDAGVPDQQKSMNDWMREFAEHGGTTSIVHFDTPEELSRNIADSVKSGLEILGETTLMQPSTWSRPLTAAGRALHVLQPVVDVVERTNVATENAMRLAAYVTRRKAGASADAAAAYAKNLTVNFNRKGRWGGVLNSLFLFYNASLQGTRRIYQLAKDHPKAIGAFLGSLAALQAQQASVLMSRKNKDGISDWDAIPEWKKSTALIIALPGGGNYFALPMPYEFGFMTYAGGRLTQAAMENEPSQHGNIVNDMGVAFLHSFSPVPLENGLSSLIPTPIETFMEVRANKDDMGRTITPGEDEGAYQKPASSLGTPGVAAPYVWLSKLLNRAGGGDPQWRPPTLASSITDVSPQALQHISDTFLGGLGSFTSRSWVSLQKALAGNYKTAQNGTVATNWTAMARDLPILNRFGWQTNTNSARADRYYDIKDDMERAKSEIQAHLDRGDIAGAQQAAREAGIFGDGWTIKTNQDGSPALRTKYIDGRPVRTYQMAAVPGTMAAAYKEASKGLSYYDPNAGQTVKAQLGVQDFNRLIHADYGLSGSERERDIKALQDSRGGLMGAFLQFYEQRKKQVPTPAK